MAYDKKSFFAILSRMKYINRWGLMRNTRSENISEHSLEVAIIAHALALIRNKRFGGQIDEARVALLALFHDATEIFTGDLPTPVKYFNPEIKSAYKKVEQFSAEKLLSLLPDDLRGEYSSLLIKQDKDESLHALVKAADKISAYIKCLQEENAGNNEFMTAKASLLKIIEGFDLPEVRVFCEEFLPAYLLTLDEQDSR